MAEDSFSGKVAVVTGGGGGIGAAIARRLAQAGARVAVAGVPADAVGAVARAVDGMAIIADVGEEPAVTSLFAAVDRAFGRLDILINNAGLGGVVAPADAIDMVDWDSVYRVNVRGVMLCMKHAIPLLKRQGGAIVNMASRAGLRGFPNQSMYASSKWAVVGMTVAIAQEVGTHGIRVNAICPGPVDTPLYRANAAARAALRGETVEDDMRRIAENAALGRLATPDDVADAALYLAGPRSGAITGEALRVDAGRF